MLSSLCSLRFVKLMQIKSSVQETSPRHGRMYKLSFLQIYSQNSIMSFLKVGMLKSPRRLILENIHHFKYDHVGIKQRVL